jgi:hypothetical protein
VVSTFPTVFQGGLQPVARTTAYDRPRETIDPDDFTGGFGVWSGTSFSAPVLAARLAKQVQAHLDEGDDQQTAVARAWTAVGELHIIAP